MTHDDFEFSISQYLDGTLAEPQRTRLEERLATDAGARALFEDHQALHKLLKSSPLPEFPWEKLQAGISDAIEQESLPAFTYPMPWVRHASRVALAACVAIAATVGWRLSTHETVIENSAIAMIEGPEHETAVGPAIVEVALDPAPADENARRFTEVVVSRPSRVIIASGDWVEFDDSMPY